MSFLNFLPEIIAVPIDHDSERSREEPIRLNLRRAVGAAATDTTSSVSAKERPGTQWIRTGLLLLAAALILIVGVRVLRSYAREATGDRVLETR